MSSPDRDTSLGTAAVISAATMFSWGFIIVKVVGLPPASIAFVRLTISAVVLGGLAVAFRIPKPVKLQTVVFAGLAFGAHQLLFISATQLTTIAIVTLIGAVAPLVIAFLSHRVVGEAPPPALKWWALLGVAGVGIVVSMDRAHESRSLLGDLLALANLVAFTIFFLFTKRARMAGTHTMALTALMQIFALVVVAPAVIALDTEMPTTRVHWGFLVLLALGPGNGHLLLNWAHQRISAALSALVLTFVPLLASLWGYLVLDEPFGWPHIVGFIMVAVAVEGGRRAEMMRHRRLRREP